MTLTAATIARDYRDPAMDAIALNDMQARLISNDSPEVDSVTERLGVIGRHLRGTAATPQLIHLFDEILELRDANVAEGGVERGICGRADHLFTDLRTLELSGTNGVGRSLAAKSIARALREPLRVIANPPVGDPRALVDAGRTVGEIMARTPAAQLFSPAVTRELRPVKAATLRALYERRAASKGAGAEWVSSGAKTNEVQARGPGEL